MCWNPDNSVFVCLLFVYGFVVAVCMCACVYVYSSVFICVCVYAHTCPSRCVCMYIYIGQRSVSGVVSQELVTVGCCICMFVWFWKRVFDWDLGLADCIKLTASKLYDLLSLISRTGFTNMCHHAQLFTRLLEIDIRPKHVGSRHWDHRQGMWNHLRSQSVLTQAQGCPRDFRVWAFYCFVIQVWGRRGKGTNTHKIPDMLHAQFH